MSCLAKLYAVYTVAASDERFLGQARLTDKDVQAIEQSFIGELKSFDSITLTDGDSVNIDEIVAIEEITEDED
ncbi:hypothetical protein LPY66_11065 [Dehalobacter sp. DCM]|uniref:hypothetical protein n=1 Tax=Dehalobacter sp. DCM TaxID=2907827 RepID=UPI003081E62A|nr:hypothetical protein LPY66_11065 [Dehalobacter sp. DCM]